MSKPSSTPQKNNAVSTREMNKARRQAVEFAGIGLFRYRYDGTIIFSNAEAVRILELEDRFPDPEKLAGRNIEDLVLYMGPKKRLRDAVKEFGEVQNFEYEFKTLKGNRKCVLYDAFPVKRRGKPDEIQVIIRDITGRKVMENELRDSEQRYRRIVETAEEGIWVVDEHSNTILVNAKTASMFHCRASEMIGRSVLSFLDMEHRDDCANVLAKCKAGHRQARELKFLRQDGTPLWTLVACNPITSMEGACCGALMMVTDISERKEYELALAREKERLAVSLRSIADGVITTDVNGQITMLNPIAEDLTGWQEREAIGRPIEDVLKVFDPETGKPAKHIYEDALRDGRISVPPCKVELACRDNKRRLITDSTAAIKDESGDIMGVIIVFRDITRQHHMEVEREKNARLESLGLLAGGIAHDFNNILTGIAGNVSLVKASFSLDSEATELLTEAEDECMRAAQLTSQLLTFSKGGAAADIQAPIGETVKQATLFALRGANVSADLRIAPHLWEVRLDPSQVDQIVHHLIRNAVQAMPSGGTVTVKAENMEMERDAAALERPAGSFVRLTVRDRGAGIPPEEQEKVFDPYYTTQPRASGMGLPIVHSIVQKHGGWVNINSRVGEGTSVEVFLPGEKAPPPTASGRGSGREKG